MHIGMVALGRMGANMCDRLRTAGIEVAGFDRDESISDVLDLFALVQRLPAAPRVVWVMVPAGAITETVVSELGELLSSGDVIIDGGNTNFHDDIRRAQELAARGIGYVDAGVSGGIWGQELGYGLMVGGPEDLIEYLMPVFDALRPEGPRSEGWVHAGGVGAGHYAKMIHNGVEYGLMQAYAEGYELLEAREDLVD